MSPDAPSDRLRVLHVITTGDRRGAEMFAADLIRALSACRRRPAGGGLAGVAALSRRDSKRRSRCSLPDAAGRSPVSGWIR